MARNTRYSRLRQMALDYAHGRISRRRYLRERAQFLDALPAQPPAGGPTSQPATGAVVRPPAEETTIPIHLGPSEPRLGRESVRPAPRARQGRILAALIGISLVVLILLLAVLPGGDGGRPAATDQGPADGGAPPAGAVTDPHPPAQGDAVPGRN